MLKTTNYQMNKPELTDSPPDITVLNGNFDIIDEKLFAIIKAWEDFKATGGEVGGPIILPYGKIFNSGSAFLIEANDDSSVMLRTTRSSDNRKGDLVINNTDAEYNVRPSSANVSGQMELGSNAFPFKDIYLSGFSKSSNGYTKLPNGFILQWGRMTVSGSAGVNVTHPIKFPNAIFSFMAIPVDNTLGTTPIHTWATGQNNSNTYVRTSASCVVQWIAIGY